ncbi:MAG: outer membrane beta-barrel domain-containing protein [Bacteriovoracaceae bacterium]|nr:outer membrane beta-barrel domain-containing protein [Bacteriovoracaceae bacterium]
MKVILATLLLLTSLSAMAEEVKPKTKKSLEDQLDELSLPANQAPAAVSKDKLYSVQMRYVPLIGAHEVSLSGAKDFKTDGHLTTNQVGLQYRYHIDDKWSIVGNYVRVFNELNNSGKLLLKEEKLVADSDFLMSQADVGAEYNMFYGKFRLGSHSVFYFDQYFALTGGMVELRRGPTPVVALDAGLAFWFGKRLGMRFGLKNNVFEETSGLGETAYRRNMVGYLAMGYLIGGSN